MDSDAILCDTIEGELEDVIKNVAPAKFWPIEGELEDVINNAAPARFWPRDPRNPKQDTRTGDKVSRPQSVN
jgi:hypothetical protein